MKKRDKPLTIGKNRSLTWFSCVYTVIVCSTMNFVEITQCIISYISEYTYYEY